MTPKAQAIKGLKKDKLDFMKIFHFCAPKDIHKIKRQPTEQEKIYASHIYDKRLTARIERERECLKLNSNDRIKNLTQNGQRARMVISPKKMYKWHTLSIIY